MLTPKQRELFDIILYKPYSRCQVIAPTQYGKSMTVGCALDLSAAVDRERYAIVTGSLEKSMIIMRQCIEHLFDSPLLIAQLEIDIALDRLRRERSKERLTFRGGGEIAVFTAQAKFKSQIKNALMGFGSPNVIEDESSLIDNDLHAMVMRMLGGHRDNFLLKIGNPFYRNHFHKSWHSNKYHKLFIDYQTALIEGRYTQDFIDEMKEEPFFSILYECKFPEADEMDERGYRPLLTIEQIKSRMGKPKEIIGEARLGEDIGGGGDFNTYILRQDNYAWIESANQSNDTMTNVSETERLYEEKKVKPELTFIDDIGIGRGCSDRLKEKQYSINPISVGSEAYQKDKYVNLKAELYWECRKWVLYNWLDDDDRFLQLAEIKYKIDSDKRLKIEPKEDLRKRGIKSPDFAEGLMLTFAKPKPKVQMYV